DVFASLDARVQLLVARLQNIQWKATRGNSVRVDLKAIKTLARKVTEDQKMLLNTQEAGARLHRALLEEFAESLIKLRKQLDEVERKIPPQAFLSPSTGTLLTKLNTGSKDLRTLIDVRSALFSLPGDSDLTALLELCLNGDVVVEVHRKINLVKTDDE